MRTFRLSSFWTRFIGFLPLVLLLPLLSAGEPVQMAEKPLVLPTYEIAPPDANPIFFTGRTYQGARGEIYPYPFYDVLTDEKIDKTYRALCLENEYIDVIVLPEIGGRILQGRDKSNGYDFFYRQTGVKPALIGMLGAWLSGGVEWNIPHHHRASSYMEIGSALAENGDGSRTVWVGETEFRSRMKWSVGLTVYPGRSYLEAKVRVTNNSPVIESMLYWANVSVHCNNDYQVIFPPATQFGTGHSKTEFTRWPIDDKGVDLSFWKNHPAPRSIFAWNEDDAFLAGYDHGREAGTVHVANPRQVAGKKFFLWGTGGTGQMWDKMLSDADGPYLELMVGAYSDNQPDYSWIFPGETREFSQFWYPIRGMKHVKNATKDAAVNFERLSPERAYLAFCSTGVFEDAKITVARGEKILFEKKVALDPASFFAEEISLPSDVKEEELTVALTAADGKKLVAYTPIKIDKDKPLPEPVAPTPAPKEIKTVEELYLAGLRIEQFQNARLNPMDYYSEALRRDPLDARVNTAVGIRALREGRFDAADKHFQNAIERLSKGYTVLRTGEPLYYLGLSERFEGRLSEAKKNFWKAAWTTDYESAAYFALAQIAAIEGDYASARESIDRALGDESAFPGRSAKYRWAKAYILRKLGGKEAEEGRALIARQIERDPLDRLAEAEASFAAGKNAEFLDRSDDLWGDDFIKRQTLLETAVDYMNLGGAEEAFALLTEGLELGGPYASPLVAYWAGFARLALGGENAEKEAKSFFESADRFDSAYNFPFRLEELELFRTVLDKQPESRVAPLLYGELLYYLERKDEAIAVWEKGIQNAPNDAPNNAKLWRNLGFAYAQKGTGDRAIAAYESAIKANPGDPRLFAELDALYEKAGKPAAERLAVLTAHLDAVMKHDDAVSRLVSLYNQTGDFKKALAILDTRHFHVWEGGREAHRYFVDAHILSGLALFGAGDADGAISEFKTADTYPTRLEKGRPDGGGSIPMIYYLIGRVCAEQGKTVEAKSAFEYAAAPENGRQAGEGELKLFRALALAEQGETEESVRLLGELKKQIDDQLAGGDSVKVDEFSKFGEEGTRLEKRANLHYLSGLLAWRDGDAEKAKSEMAEALKLSPGLIWAKTFADERLAELVFKKR